MATELLNVSILFKPSKKLRGVWVAHVLDFELVTQGDSLKHAFQMALEAIGLVILADREAGKDRARRKAPARYWDAFRRVTEEGRPIEELGQDGDADAFAVVAQVWVMDRPAAQESPRPPAKAKTAPASRPQNSQSIAWAL
ncbi:MAG: type II toxin-antitoxin system HicB family antitoxin [Myxococcota bacterium]